MIDIKEKLGKQGLYITPLFVYNQKIERILMPLNINDSNLLRRLNMSDIYQLSLLESLWEESLLFEDKEPGVYYMLYEYLYDIEDDYKKILKIKDKSNIKVYLKARGTIMEEKFCIDAVLTVNGRKLDLLDKRYKNLIEHEEVYYLIPRNVYELLDEIDNYVPNSDTIARFKFVAKVKIKAKLANADMDKYLANQEIYYTDSMDYEIRKDSDVSLEVLPRFNDEIDKLLKDKHGKLKIFNNVSSGGLKRKYLIVDEKTRDAYNNLIENGSIRGGDVPKFLSNPFSVLPEDIDLELFSKRVKGIEIRVYRMNPYVAVKENNKTGWFDFDFGGTLQVESGLEIDNDESQDVQPDEDKSNKKLSFGEFKSVVQKALDNGDEYVYYNGSWIHIDPKAGRQFINTVENDVKNDINRSVDIKKLRYILKIFENINGLEYNEVAINLKNQLVDDIKLDMPVNLRYLKDTFRLYPYQIEGFNWLKRLYLSSLGGLLADDMGLGKTLQLIALLCFLKESNDLLPSLIIVPYTLIDVWVNEIEKFSNINSIYKHIGPKRCKDTVVISSYDVVLTTYDTLVRDQFLLGKIDWKAVICDEAQKIKNTNTLSTRSVKALKSRIKIASTGTPVENSLGELWCIIDYVQPGLLESYKDFRNKYQIPIEQSIKDGGETYSEVKERLLKKIKPIYLRRTKEGILNLPPKHDEIIRVEMTPLQEEYYSKIISYYLSRHEEAAIGVLQKLLEVCDHPFLINDEFCNKTSEELVTSSGKLKILLNILDLIENKDEKCVIFTKYKKMQSILKKL